MAAERKRVPMPPEQVRMLERTYQDGFRSHFNDFTNAQSPGYGCYFLADGTPWGCKASLVAKEPNLPPPEPVDDWDGAEIVVEKVHLPDEGRWLKITFIRTPE